MSKTSWSRNLWWSLRMINPSKMFTRWTRRLWVVEPTELFAGSLTLRLAKREHARPLPERRSRTGKDLSWRSRFCKHSITHISWSSTNSSKMTKMFTLSQSSALVESCLTKLSRRNSSKRDMQQRFSNRFYKQSTIATHKISCIEISNRKTFCMKPKKKIQE